MNKDYLATTPSLDCNELFIVRRCSPSTISGDGVAFITCDKDGALCVMKKSSHGDRYEATTALQNEVDMLLLAWPRKLRHRVFVANWNSTPFIFMPFLRIVSTDDSDDLGIDVEVMVRKHIDKLAAEGLCHDDLHWRHVACYVKRDRHHIVFIDWARSRTGIDTETARSIMLRALDLE